MIGEKKQQKVKKSNVPIDALSHNGSNVMAHVELNTLTKILEQYEKHDADIALLKKANDHNFLELQKRIAEDLVRLAKAEQTIGKLAAESEKICDVIEKLNEKQTKTTTDLSILTNMEWIKMKIQALETYIFDKFALHRYGLIISGILHIIWAILVIYLLNR